MLIDPYAQILPALSEQLNNETALSLANEAKTLGISHILSVTPINGPEAKSRDLANLRQAQFQEELVRRGFSLTIFVAHEVVITAKKPTLDLEHMLYPDLNPSYVLWRFEDNHIPQYLPELFFQFLRLNIRPVLTNVAHNRILQKRQELLLEMLDEGAYVLLDAPSLIDKKPKQDRKFAEYLISHGLVHLLGSNTNQAGYGPLRTAYEMIERRYGDTYAFDLKQNAKALLNGEPFVEHFTIKQQGWRRN